MSEGVTLRESVRIVRGTLPLLPLHLERLAEGGTPPAILSAIGPTAEAAARGAGADAVKLHLVVSPAEGRFSIDLDPHPSTLAVPGGPAIVPVTVRSLPWLPPNAAKPADRSFWDGPQRLALLQGGRQAILVTSDGLVVDGGTATVWAVLGRTLVTPPAPPAIAGVARRLILADLAPALALRTEVRPLTLEELEGADEVLLSNAVGGVVPAAGRGGTVAEELASAFEAVVESLAE